MPETSRPVSEDDVFAREATVGKGWTRVVSSLRESQTLISPGPRLAQE